MAIQGGMLRLCGTFGARRHFGTCRPGLARKLLVALWRFVESGLVPAGALLKA